MAYTLTIDFGLWHGVGSFFSSTAAHRRTAKAPSKGKIMQAVTGIFTPFEQARHSAEEVMARGFSKEQINLLAPGSSVAEIENQAEVSRQILQRNGAEGIDAAREQW